MALKITLPRLVGTREAADELVARTTGSPDDGVVYVNGRALATSTISFADELVKKLVERGASKIMLVSAPERFERQISDVITRHDHIAVDVVSNADLAQL